MSESGVIHDIGYRHYDGPRLGASYITRSLFVSSLKGAYGFGRSAKSKVVPLLLLAAMAVPALIIAAVVNVTGENSLPLDYTQYQSNLIFVVIIYTGAQAPQMVSRDLRFGVVSLYFSRPLTRQAYVQAKFAAMAAAVFVLTAVPLVVLYVGALLAKISIWPQTKGFFYGLVGAALLSLVMAGLGLVIAATTPRRGLGIAAIVAVLIVAHGVSAIIAGISQDQGNDTLAGYAGLIAPGTLVDGVVVWAFGTENASVEPPPGNVGGVAFLLVAVLLVAACYGLLLRRYRKVSVS